jgi:hypothetical protein
VISLLWKGFIRETEAEEELHQLEKELDALTQQCNWLRWHEAQYETVSNRMSDARMLLEQLRRKIGQAAFQTRRHIVDTLVDHIWVETAEGGKRVPKIKFRCRFEPRLSHRSENVKTAVIHS